MLKKKKERAIGPNLESIWPCSARKLNASFLESLTDSEFMKLIKLIRMRILRSGAERTHAKNVSRRIRLKRGCRRRFRGIQCVLARRFRQSRILDNIVPDRLSKWKSPISRHKKFDASLKNFSFIDNPVETMNSLYKLADAETYAVSGNLDFDDPYVTDIGSYLVLGIMDQDMFPFSMGGRMGPGIREVLDAVDLRRVMGIKKGKANYRYNDIWAFQIRRRRKPGNSTALNHALRPSTKEKVSDEFVDAVDEWLGALDPPYELSKDGKAYLCRMIGEILDNAERHSRAEGDGDWSIAGFMVRRQFSEKEKPVHICHIAIVSVGSTIAETILNSEDQVIRKQLEEYCQRHGSILIGNRRDREMLATVYALQDGVSRFQQSSDTKGGVGIMDMVEFANDLGGDGNHGTSPSIAIISGKTCVHFRGVYSNFRTNLDDNRRQQWFNVSNSLDLPPDSTHVHHLPHSFPGVLTTMRFELDSGFYEG